MRESSVHEKFFKIGQIIVAFVVSSSAVLALALVIACSSSTSAPGTSATSSATASSTPPSGWEQYANNHGNSSIEAYEIGADYIRVLFKDGPVYLYTYESAGADNIEHMKELARAGDGLNSFIMRRVKYKYASKQR